MIIYEFMNMDEQMQPLRLGTAANPAMWRTSGEKPQGIAFGYHSPTTVTSRIVVRMASASDSAPVATHAS